MLEHLFVADDGALYDTRQPNWSKSQLRSNYRRSHREIKSVADYKATIRNGRFAWPGGYPLYLLCDDGAALCFACARKEAQQIIPAIANKERNGWRVVACDVNYEDTDLHCEHCSERIESAYAD